MKIVSERQRRFLGARASGASSGPGPTPAKATLMLRENKGRMRGLPERAPVREAARTPRRVSYRGRR